MDDELVAWLRAQLDQDERKAQDVHRVGCASIPEAGYNGPFPCDCGWPERELAQVAVWRRILDRSSDWGEDDGRYAFGYAARVLAEEVYATRPGYREEWKTL